MKTKKTQMALVIAAAFMSLAQAHGETITITSQFTPLEDLSAKDRAALHQRFENEMPAQSFDWENVIMGKNEKGQVEVRDKNTLTLQSVIEPTCYAK
jgi:hypothetical protein